MTLRSALLSSTFAFSLLPLLAAKQQDQTQLHDRLQKAATISSLDDNSLQPWHWKVSFTQYEVDTKASHAGTLEMWSQNGNMRTIATLDSAQIIILRIGDKLYRTSGDENSILAAAHLQMELLHPIPEAVLDPAVTLTLMRQKAGKAKLDCFQPTLVKKTNDVVLIGHETSYCTDKDSSHLVITWVSADLSVLRQRIGTFQSHDVPVEMTFSSGKDPLLDAKTESLDSGTFDPSLFRVTSEFSAFDGPVTRKQQALRGLTLSQNPPVYPAEAKLLRSSGSILFDAVIGKDGHITSLTPNGKSNPLLLESARKAVETWVYRPLEINGIPFELITQITVNFAMGD